jgi:hypothetical protein
MDLAKKVEILSNDEIVLHTIIWARLSKERVKHLLIRPFLVIGKIEFSEEIWRVD